MSITRFGLEYGRAGEPSSNWKLQTRPHVREGAPHEQSRFFLTVMKFGYGTQMGAWYKGGLAD